MKLSFRPVYTALGKAQQYRPQEFEFVGQVKPGGNWEVICKGTHYAEYKSTTEEHGCETSAPIDHGFQCLGMRITKRMGYGSVGLSRIRIWIAPGN